MLRLLKTLPGLIVILAGLAVPSLAQAFDAGVRAPLLTDRAPGAVSVPFEIPFRQSAAVPQPLEFEVAVQGFSLDPAAIDGTRIGSLDMVTDAGDFDDKAIYSDGPGADGTRTWTLDWQLSNDPITATVTDGTGLDASGEKINAPDSTLITFTVPGNYHGFRLMGLSLRFNQEDHGMPTPGVGAVNPVMPGNYLIRSRIRSVAPQSAVKVASTTVPIGLEAPKTRLVASANRFRVRRGGKVRISMRTANQTRDTVGIWLRGKRLRKVKVGPATKHIYWRPGRKFRGRRAVLHLRPAHGPDRQLVIRVIR
ncbi:MAG: hypothetical protein KDB54_01165 [Solirubrobacterales bacterium]|nr:hypothetical protein [Solirubrobacterales bacterium]